MTRRLRRNVLARQGTRGVFLAKGDVVPEWAVGVLDEKHIEDVEDGAHEAPSSTPDVPEKPPLKGPGSGRAAWAEYAVSQGLEVTDDMTKADIVNALD